MHGLLGSLGETGPILRLGLPDRFVEHGDRAELFADLGIDAAGIAAACRRLAGRPRGLRIPRLRQRHWE